MSAAPAPPAAWFESGWGYRLLPHYRWGTAGLETLGGRAVPLSGEEHRLLQKCSGRTWRPGKADGEAARLLSGLIARRLVVPLPPPVKVRQEGPVDLVLSPHIDDAALSLGAAIAAQLRPTLVLSVFSRQSYQTGLRVPGSRLDALARDEDRLAGEILGYASVFAGLRGAQDRHGWPLSAVIGCDFGAASMAERIRRDGGEMVADIDGLLALIASLHVIGRLFVPSGIGGHLDHLVVRSQAQAIADRLQVPGAAVHVYADLPYATLAGNAAEIGSRPGHGGDALARKHAALLAFATRLRLTEITRTMAFSGETGERWAPLDEPDQAALLANAPACSRR